MDSTSKSKKSPKLPDDEILRAESRKWSALEWEAHLKTVEVGLSESLSSKAEVLNQSTASNIFELSSSACSEELSEIVNLLLTHLSERQVLVLRKIFWDGMSERKIAHEMKVSRQAVYDLKKRALRNLRKHAQGVLATSPIVQANVFLMADKIDDADENPAA